MCAFNGKHMVDQASKFKWKVYRPRSQMILILAPWLSLTSHGQNTSVVSSKWGNWGRWLSFLPNLILMNTKSLLHFSVVNPMEIVYIWGVCVCVNVCIYLIYIKYKLFGKYMSPKYLMYSWNFKPHSYKSPPSSFHIKWHKLVPWQCIHLFLYVNTYIPW